MPNVYDLIDKNFVEAPKPPASTVCHLNVKLRFPIEQRDNFETFFQPFVEYRKRMYKKFLGDAYDGTPLRAPIGQENRNENLQNVCETTRRSLVNELEENTNEPALGAPDPQSSGKRQSKENYGPTVQANSLNVMDDGAGSEGKGRGEGFTQVTEFFNNINSIKNRGSRTPCPSTQQMPASIPPDSEGIDAQTEELDGECGLSN